MLKLKVPSGIVLQSASIPAKYDKISVIVGSEERIYDQVFAHAIVNNRIVKVLKESLVYERV